MKNFIWALILILVIGGLGCAGGAAPTSKSTSTATPSPTQSSPKAPPAVSKPPSPSPTPVVVTTPMARPQPGKSQELTFLLKPPSSTYSLVIYLEKGETLELDWKFVSNPQAGINFMFTTPEGREMDARVQPLNISGHPLYDPNLPSQKTEELVGSNLAIKAGQDKYCSEGYYSLVFAGTQSQAGTVYLRYSLTLTPAN